MCFSAPASFLAAGAIGAVGVACLAHTQSPREWPLAAMPLLFAFQQAIEGALWLTLPVAPDGPRATMLALVFLIFAKVFWPVYAPLTALLVEPDARRRWAMGIVLAAGTASAMWFLRSTLAVDAEASVLGGHIVYGPKAELPVLVVALYMTATCAAALLSSHAAVRLLGLIVIAGAALTFVYYWHAFTSVWCFFAAAASIVILVHFVRASRHAAMQRV